jgi:hypothetical protein
MIEKSSDELEASGTSALGEEFRWPQCGDPEAVLQPLVIALQQG